MGSTPISSTTVNRQLPDTDKNGDKMKKTLLLALAIAMAFGLAACGSVDPETAYVEFVREHDPSYADAPEEEILAGGPMACALMGDSTVDEFVTAMVGLSALDTDNVEGVASAADVETLREGMTLVAKAFCPDKL